MIRAGDGHARTHSIHGHCQTPKGKWTSQEEGGRVYIYFWGCFSQKGLQGQCKMSFYYNFLGRCLFSPPKGLMGSDPTPTPMHRGVARGCWVQNGSVKLRIFIRCVFSITIFRPPTLGCLIFGPSRGCHPCVLGWGVRRQWVEGFSVQVGQLINPYCAKI